MKKIFLLIVLINLLSCIYVEDAVGTYGLYTTRKVLKTLNVLSPEKDKKIEYISKITNYVDLYWSKDQNTNHEVFEYKSVKLERFSKKDKKNKAAIYFVHGGAYILPLINSYRALAQYMINQNDNFDIVFIDYKTLPKYTYPSANIDVSIGLEWIFENYENVYAMGDSAGGNLILSEILKRRDKNMKLPKALVLISPFLDIEGIVDSRKRNRKNDLLVGGKKSKYLIDSPYYENYDKTDPYISPIYANYHNFIPTYIEVNKDEMLYDDSYIVYNKMKKENIDATLVESEKRFHVYQVLIYTNEAKDSINKILRFFQKQENIKKNI